MAAFSIALVSKQQCVSVSRDPRVPRLCERRAAPTEGAAEAARAEAEITIDGYRGATEHEQREITMKFLVPGARPMGVPRAGKGRIDAPQARPGTDSASLVRWAGIADFYFWRATAASGSPTGQSFPRSPDCGSAPSGSNPRDPISASVAAPLVAGWY
jgi:hypothetical protein